MRSAFKASLDFAGADGLSIVVANAGFTSDVFVKDLKTGDDSGWINGVQGNVIGTFLLARLSLSYWLEKDMRAAFVVTSSVAGMHGMYSLEGWRKRGHSSMIYGAVKAAQVAFVENTQLTLETRAKTKKMPRAQQRFTAVLPGAVFTNIWRMSSKEEVIKAGLTTDNWVPMEKLVDSFMRNITDEDRRGSSWVVAGSAGDEVRYPDPPVVSQEKYYRRAEDDRAKL